MLPAALKGCVKMAQVNINFWILNRMLPGKISHRDESGFTMLEIVASVAILAIAIIPMLGLFAGAPVLHAQREQQTRAVFLAQKKVEELKHEMALDFDAERYGGSGKYGEGDYQKSAGYSTDFTAPDTKFRYTVSHDEGTNIKELTITVWYDDDANNVQDDGEQGLGTTTKVARRRG